MIGGKGAGTGRRQPNEEAPDLCRGRLGGVRLDLWEGKDPLHQKKLDRKMST
jgi:hypothetical protein